MPSSPPPSSRGATWQVSLDGYDSETDEWMEGDDARIAPAEGETHSADEKVRDLPISPCVISPYLHV